MEQIYFYFNSRYCINCNSCRVSCQTNNNTGFEINRREVVVHYKGVFPDVERYSLSVACNHCENPACIKVCAKKAIIKNSNNGIVTVNEQDCIYCKRCVAACPYGTPQKDEIKKKL